MSATKPSGAPRALRGIVHWLRKVIPMTQRTCPYCDHPLAVRQHQHNGALAVCVNPTCEYSHVEPILPSTTHDPVAVACPRGCGMMVERSLRRRPSLYTATVECQSCGALMTVTRPSAVELAAIAAKMAPPTVADVDVMC